MARVNIVQLESVIAQCSHLAVDGQISEKAQDRFMEKAILLGRCLAALEAEEFGGGEQGVTSANQQLVEVNDRLEDVKAGLGNIPESIAALGRLTGTLDTLVTLVELTLASLPGIHGDTRANFRS